LSDEYKEDYEVDLGDITYIEDIDFFGINSITGLPNKEKVLVSEIDLALIITKMKMAIFILWNIPIE
jgi:hypothetical protein